MDKLCETSSRGGATNHQQVAKTTLAMSGMDISIFTAHSTEEVPGFDSLCGRQFPTGWVGVSIM